MANKRSGGCLGGLLFLLFSGHLGCIGMAIALIVLVVAVSFAAVLAYYVTRVLLVVGLLVGLVITIRNYCLALYHNVKREKVTP